MPPKKQLMDILRTIDLGKTKVPEFISWDPGETTGVACWDDRGNPIAVAQMEEADRDRFLNDLHDCLMYPSKFIVEEYRIFGSKATAHIGKKLNTSEVIGDLKSFARKHWIEVVEQPSSILNIAQKWSGVKIPTVHAKSHWASAYNHGYYYLHQQGIIRPRVLDE